MAGFIIVLNVTPVHWFSKKQTAFEMSFFVCNFLAMDKCCEYLKVLRYIFSIMGIPLKNLCFIYDENHLVL